MQTILSLLREDARKWWHHVALREAGRIDEAQEKERRSIRYNVEMWRNAAKYAPEGRAYVMINRDGEAHLYSATDSGSMSCGPFYGKLDLVLTICAKYKIVVIDSRPADRQKMIEVVVRKPMIATAAHDIRRYNEGAEGQGWLSYVPLLVAIDWYADAGCEILNW